MNILRLLYVTWILAYYRIDKLVPLRSLKLFLSPFILINPYAWFNHMPEQRGRRLRLTLEKLGPIFVKFGQMLSTRPDLIPEDIVNELEKLQDQVPPFASTLAIAILEDTYQQPIANVFASFDPQPLASASVAQVHAATLKSGEDVIVKIIRPQIETTIAADIRLLYSVARFLQCFWRLGNRLRLTELVAEFDKTLTHELDMQREAANAAQLKRNFSQSTIIHIPAVYWDYIHRNILVMERIYGVRISNISELKARGVDMKKLAEHGIEIFYTQVFRDKFFHADMHPGNVFVDIKDPANPTYCAVDFGIMGSLSDDDQYYLAMNFLAFFNRDYRQVAQLHIDSGWVPANTRVDEMESAIRTVCEPIFNKPLNEISYGKVLVRLFQVAQQFEMVIQPQLLLLQKTLLTVEGLGRQLYPELNLWETAKPHLENIMRNQMGWRGLWHKLKQRLPMWLEEIPELIDHFMQKINIRK